MSVKQTLSLALSGLLFSTLLQPVFAQTTTPSAEVTVTPTSVTTPNPTLSWQRNFRSSIKTSLQTLKQMNATRQEMFRSQLTTIKNERQKTILDRLHTQLSFVNENKTEKMNAALDRLEAILNRLKEDTTRTKQSGIDTALVDQAILDADTALNAASTALSTQASKTYTFDVTNDKMKPIVGKTVSQMQQDLQSVHQKVVVAKQAIWNVAKALHTVLIHAQLSGTPIPTIFISPTSTVTPTVLP